MSFRFVVLTIAFAGLLPSDYAIAQASNSSAKMQSAPSNLTISDKDNRTNVDLTTGQTLIVRLPSNPSTGYAWVVNGDPAPLKLTKSFSVRSKGTSGMVGAPRTAVLEFNAASSGVTTLTLLYRRSWEYNVAPTKTFTVTVSVR
jgi:inhibitor of cysteine peptidase